MFKEENRTLGVGSLALVLAAIGIAWGFTFFGVCLGDIALGFAGIKAWSNGSSGVHYAAFYSLIFFASAFVVGITHKDDLGSYVGRVITVAFGSMVAFCALVVIFTMGL